MPHMAAVMRALWAGSSSNLRQALPGTCYSFAAALYCQDTRRISIGSQQQLEAWVAAADAGMRLLPLLRQLDARWRQQQDLQPAVQEAAVLTSRRLLRMILVGSTGAWASALQSGSALAADARAGLAEQLAQLHSRSCRLLHWLAAEDNRAVLPNSGSAQDWHLLQQCICAQFDAADHLAPQGRGPSQPGHVRWAHTGFCECGVCIDSVATVCDSQGCCKTVPSN